MSSGGLGTGVLFPIITVYSVVGLATYKTNQDMEKTGTMWIIEPT